MEKGESRKSLPRDFTIAFQDVRFQIPRYNQTGSWTDGPRCGEEPQVKPHVQVVSSHQGLHPCLSSDFSEGGKDPTAGKMCVCVGPFVSRLIQVPQQSVTERLTSPLAHHAAEGVGELGY